MRDNLNSRFASKRGPTSANWTSLCDVLAKTWCLISISATALAHFSLSYPDLSSMKISGPEYHLPTHLKEMKSASLANVMILLASSFGTGNKAFNIPETRSPNFVLNPSNIK